MRARARMRERRRGRERKKQREEDDNRSVTQVSSRFSFARYAVEPMDRDRAVVTVDAMFDRCGATRALFQSETVVRRWKYPSHP